ncbi:hypothetical protein KIN20_021555 [Parelaphostrongylus tenuis]|uniref:Integrator complex subunit 10 n=1 Tax=Parelaphostrongylus tenuis TaxID=148309 RepID=A0AAD5QRN6_PARTN|nr:hypothetical protein KIN20_021555 [Parelaphostrongylus tenuis]
MSKSTSVERKRRRFEVEWEGFHEDLRTRVLMSENYITARYRMLLISSIRKDISDEFKQLLELQMRIKFGEYDDAISYLNEVMRDNRDFIYKVIDIFSDDYIQRGVENIEGYGCFFQHYELDQGVALFRRAADANPEKACAIMLTYLAMRPQAFSAVSGFLMDILRKSPEPPHGLYAFGTSLLTINFGNLMPEDILFVCDAILRSAFRESLTDVVGDNKDTRKKCDRNANKFIGLTYPFFVAVTSKLGLPIFGAKVERSGVLLEKLVTSLPDKWSPPATRAVVYALCIARLKLPSFVSRTRQKEIKLDFDPTKNFIGHGVFNSIATLCSKLSPFSPEFQYGCQLAGAVDTGHIIATSYLYTRQYTKCIEFCTSELTKRDKDEPQLLAAIVAAHYQLADVASVVQAAVCLIPIIIKNDWCSPHPAITNGGVGTEEPFWFIRCSAAGHWLCTVLLNTLYPLLSDDNTDDLLISTVLLLSQVDFSSVGYSSFNDAISVADHKKSFKSTDIFEFIGDIAVMDRMIFMASSRPESFLPESTGDAQTEIQKNIGARMEVIDESKKIMLTIQYLSKVGADLIKLVQSNNQR